MKEGQQRASGDAAAAAAVATGGRQQLVAQQDRIAQLRARVSHLKAMAGRQAGNPGMLAQVVGWSWVRAQFACRVVRLGRGCVRVRVGDRVDRCGVVV